MARLKWQRLLAVGFAILMAVSVCIDSACAPKLLPDPLAPPFSYIIPACNSMQSTPKVEEEGQSMSWDRHNPHAVAQYCRLCRGKDSNLKDTTLIMWIRQYSSEERAHAHIDEDRWFWTVTEGTSFLTGESLDKLRQSGADEAFGWRDEDWGFETTWLEAVRRGKCRGGSVAWGINFRVGDYVGEYWVNCENPLVMPPASTTYEYIDAVLWLEPSLCDAVVEAANTTILFLRQQAIQDNLR